MSRRIRPSDPNRWTASLLAVVFVGASLRLYRIGHESLWLDEALTANIAARPLGEIGDRLRVDGHPPLY
ncbi:MAG: hypothetical protein QXG03_09480, partial [Halalkalicoccus sp.]